MKGDFAGERGLEHWELVRRLSSRRHDMSCRRCCGHNAWLHLAERFPGCSPLSGFAEPPFGDGSAIAQEIEMVGPVPHHAHALVPIFTARLGAANGFAVAVRKLALNRVGMPKPHLIEQLRCHGAKAVAGHFVLSVAHPA
jgi:hypothetical protein